MKNELEIVQNKRHCSLCIEITRIYYEELKKKKTHKKLLINKKQLEMHVLKSAPAEVHRPSTSTLCESKNTTNNIQRKRTHHCFGFHPSTHRPVRIDATQNTPYKQSKHAFAHQLPRENHRAISLRVLGVPVCMCCCPMLCAAICATLRIRILILDIIRRTKIAT